MPKNNLTKVEEKIIDFLGFISSILEKNGWNWTIEDGIFRMEKGNDVYQLTYASLFRQQRKEILEEVVEEIEKMKYKEEKGLNSLGEFSNFPSANPAKPEEALNQFIYNQTLQDIIKAIKKL